MKNNGDMQDGARTAAEPHQPAAHRPEGPTSQRASRPEPAARLPRAASASPRRGVRVRLAVLALGAACVLAGLDAALLRLGVWSPVRGAELAALHGPLMLAGFFGTVITLERAVALSGRPAGRPDPARPGEPASQRGRALALARRFWPFAAPLGCAVGSLALLAGAPSVLGRGLLVLGGAALCAIYVQVHRRAPGIAVDLEAMGGAALLLGDVLWLGGLDVTAVVPLWLLFPVLTIVGERLELARVAFLDDAVEETVRALGAVALLGACLLTVTDLARLVVGPAVLGLAVVMAWYDVARRTVRARGVIRFMAASMLAGYVWLALAGATWTLTTIADGAGPAYEIVIHAIGLGFAFSMILAHAPTIVPAVVHRRLPYHRAMWVPYVLLHAGLAVRVAGLLADAALPWQAGGVLGVLAILVFLAVALVRAVSSGSISRPSRRS